MLNLGILGVSDMVWVCLWVLLSLVIFWKRKNQDTRTPVQDHPAPAQVSSSFSEPGPGISEILCQQFRNSYVRVQFVSPFIY